MNRKKPSHIRYLAIGLILSLVLAYLFSGNDTSTSTPAKLPPKEPAQVPDVARHQQAQQSTVDEDTRQKIGALPTVEFCLMYGVILRDPEEGLDSARGVAMQARAMRDHSMSTEHHKAIRERSIMMGMNLCEILAALGTPTRAHHTVTLNGTRDQIIFDNLHIFLENERVVAWSN